VKEELFERLKAELARAFAAQGGAYQALTAEERDYCSQLIKGGNFRATVLRIYPLLQAGEGSRSTYAVFLCRL